MVDDIKAADGTGADRTGADGSGDEGARRRGLFTAGRIGWAIIGVAGALAVVGYLLGYLALVVIPVILALFPATLLSPLARLLKQWMPDALAAILALLAGLTFLGLVIGLMVPLVVAEIPELSDTASDGISEIERFLDDAPLGLDFGGISELVDRVRDGVGDAGEFAGTALEAAAMAFEIVAGLLLAVVALFFLLKDDERIGQALVELAPRRHRPRVERVGRQLWETLGAFFRGQLIVAFADAFFIGLGLVILGVPLALPLAVLTFFGGLFPIVGAVTAGALAVLVALAHGGLTTGLIVLGIILAVQQLEGNVLQPLILGHVVRLHPLVIILSVTAGAVTLGVLGAFLAVPMAAVVSEIVRELRSTDADEVSTAEASST